MIKAPRGRDGMLVPRGAADSPSSLSLAQTTLVWGSRTVINMDSIIKTVWCEKGRLRATAGGPGVRMFMFYWSNLIHSWNSRSLSPPLLHRQFIVIVDFSEWTGKAQGKGEEFSSFLPSTEPFWSSGIPGKTRSCLLSIWVYHWGQGASLVAQLVKDLPAEQETQVQFLAWEDPLEKEMATHSSILAWRIPWTEEHGGLQSMGSQELDMT